MKKMERCPPDRFLFGRHCKPCVILCKDVDACQEKCAAYAARQLTSAAPVSTQIQNSSLLPDADPSHYFALAVLLVPIIVVIVVLASPKFRRFVRDMMKCIHTEVGNNNADNATVEKMPEETSLIEMQNLVQEDETKVDQTAPVSSVIPPAVVIVEDENEEMLNDNFNPAVKQGAISDDDDTACKYIVGNETLRDNLPIQETGDQAPYPLSNPQQPDQEYGPSKFLTEHGSTHNLSAFSYCN